MSKRYAVVMGLLLATVLALASAVEAASALNIYVETDEGKPVAGATVVISSPDGIMARITDEYGEAIFNNLSTGWYDVEVTKDDVTVYDQVYVGELERRRHIVLLG